MFNLFGNILSFGVRVELGLVWKRDCQPGWDETGQRVQGISKGLLAGERPGHGKVCMQVMMQKGAMHIYEFTGEGGAVTRSEPLFARGIVLESQTADSILEGVLRSFPVKVEDPVYMHSMAASSDMVLLSFCTDRAAANFKALDFLWDRLCAPDMPVNVFFHVEPCAAHGVALVKSRPGGPKEVLVGASTFSALMRQWRFSTALRDELIKLVSSKLRVVTEPRPHEHLERNWNLVRLLYGDPDSEYLHKTRKSGERVKTGLLQDIEALVDAVSLGHFGPDALCHWCDDGTGIQDAEHRSAGRPCCNSRDESVSKVVVPILNLLAHRPWAQSAENRWTYVLTTLKKWALGCLCHKLLPEAVVALKTHWGLSEAVLAMLERIVAADANDYNAKSKLRLLRVVKTLCQPSVPWKIGIVVQTLDIVDRLLYAILGDGVSSRATLLSFLSESDSLLSKCQQSLLGLARVWTPEVWSLCAALGGDLGDPEVKLFARRQVLQLSASLCDHFELRMSKPPYSLAKLGDPAVSRDRQRRLAAEFLREPEHCLPELCKRLRNRCPTVDSLLVDAPRLIEALSSTSIAIDFLERSHAQMRVDLKSSGHSKSFVASSNRVLCHQVSSHHQTLHGHDPALAPPLALQDADGGGMPLAVADLHPKKKAKHLGGNPLLSFTNHKMATFKRVHARDRALTVAEMHGVRGKSAEEFEQLSAVQKASWTNIWRAEHWGRQARPEVGAVVAVEPQPVGRIWGGDGDKYCPLPPSALVAQHKDMDKKSRNECARCDPDLVVNSAPPRASTMAPPERCIFGCYNNKKNVCRIALGDDMSRRVDGLVALFSSWVDSLTATVANRAESLLWLQGRSPDGVVSVDMAALLVDARYRPKAQIFAKCLLQGGRDQTDEQFVMPAFPCTLKLAFGPTRLSNAFEGLRFATSDEICLEMVRLGLTWSIVPLEWTLPPAGECLMHMVVTGAGEPFVPEKKARQPRSDVKGEFKNMMDVLELGDPVQLGVDRANAMAAASSGDSGLAAPPSESVARGLPSDLADFMDEAALDGMPRDVVADILEAFVEANGLEDVHLAEEAVGGDVEAGEDGDESGGEEVDLENVGPDGALETDGPLRSVHLGPCFS